MSSSCRVMSWSLMFLIPVLLMLCCSVDCQLNGTSLLSLLFINHIENTIDKLNALADLAGLIG